MTSDDTVNILLVDDSPAKLLTYEAVLADLGENLLKASSARDALETLLRHDIAVILIDVCMPDLDGFELVGMIRAHPRFNKTAIILVSAVFLSDDDRLRGYASGAIDYVSVPIIPGILRAKVSAFADLHRKTRQLERLNEELERRVAARTLDLERSSAELRAGQERLKLAVEGAGIATWDADLRTGVVVVSPTYFTILGRPSEPDVEPTLDLWRESIHPQDRIRIERALAKARDDCSVFAPEHRIVRACDGDVAWLSIFGRFLYDASGQAIRFVGVFFDITARKLNERRIASEHAITRVMAAPQSLQSAAPALLRAIRASFDAAVAILWLPEEDGESMRCECIEHPAADRELETFANSLCKRRLQRGGGYAGRAWAESTPVIVPDLRAVRDTDERAGAEAAGLSAAVAFPLVAGDRCGGLVEYFTREPLEHGAVLPDMLSAIGGLVARYLARLELEAALGASRQRLALAVAAGNVGTLMFDVARNRILGDERVAFFFDVDPREAERGLPLEDYLAAVDQQDRGRVEALIRQHVELGGELAVECRVRAADGEIHWIRGSGRVELDASGNPVRLPGAVVDMTEPMRMQEALREADRRKDEFIAILSHELRNPLAPIRNALDLLRLGRRDPKVLDLAESIMERQVRQLVRLTDDLLDVSRITRNKLELRRERVQLSHVFQNAIEMVRSAIESASQHLEVVIPERSIVLDGDPIRLAQIFSNLLDNASKYTARGGKIQIRAEQHGAEVVVSVRDNGVGIPSEMLSNIFDIFTQVRGNPEQVPSGLGIGLTIVRRLIELHDGSIEARSDGVGRGSEFVVHLPIVDVTATASDESHSEPKTVQLAASTGIRIVVADDNVDAATSLSLLLRMMGHDTRTAHDGLAVVELVRSFQPHVVMLDIGMPLLDGYGAARRIRALPRGGDTVLVALTGWGQDEDRQRGKAAGIDHHLVKPVDVSELTSVLEGIVQRSDVPYQGNGPGAASASCDA